MTDCIARIDGCADCDDRVARKDPDHQCAAMCEIALGIMDTPKGHRIWHEPMRHPCGFILDDKRGNKFQGEPVLCFFGTCVQIFCPGCRRYDMGWGRILCPCETRSSGHGTRQEFARPSLRRLVKRRR